MTHSIEKGVLGVERGGYNKELLKDLCHSYAHVRRFDF